MAAIGSQTPTAPRPARLRRRGQRGRVHAARRGLPKLLPQWFVELQAGIAAGTVKVDHRARSHSERWSAEVVPAELKPFVESLEFRDLLTAVRMHWWLYFHPLVQHALLHLRVKRGTHDDQSVEATKAHRRLTKLVEAHARAMRVGNQISWRTLPGKPGPKGNIRNPAPAYEGSQFVTACELEESAAELKQALEDTSRDLLTHLLKEPNEDTRERLVDLVKRASGRVSVLWSKRVTIDATAPLPADLVEWNVPGSGWAVQIWADENGRNVWDTDLRAVVEGVLDCRAERERLDRYGRAQYLAYAVLGALLDVPANKIRCNIENYQRSERRRGRLPLARARKRRSTA